MSYKLIDKLTNVAKQATQAGDTLVEVMISIAVVALAIGLTYSISGKNLAVGITARERTEAVALVQSQIEGITAASRAGSLSGINIKDSSYHFCLDTNNAPIKNTGVDPVNKTFSAPDNNDANYVSACVSGGKYYLDINYVPKTGGPTPSGDSLAFSAQWHRLGGGSDQIVTIYYRPW